MRIQKFEDVIAWQKSKEPTKHLYILFGSHKDYGFRDQILRASVSIMNNIAEGFDRGSDRELKQFLVIARGSTAEVRSMLILAAELNYIGLNEKSELIDTTHEISRLLTGFIKSLKLTKND